MKKKFVSVLTLMAAASMAQAANITWTGGTADYTNAANWTGGVVPGATDTAINDSGSNNAVRISAGNPDWSLNQVRAGNSTGDGAFLQNGQTVNLRGTNGGAGFNTSLRLGVAAGKTGIYTLNGGVLNYTNGSFNVGELGVGVLNVNGGTINGSGIMAVNLGTPATPVAVNATVGAGLSEGDFTWFEQGYNAGSPSTGLPTAGTTITSLSQADHSYNLPPNYATNNAVLLESNLVSGTITLQPATVATGLSFLLTSGNGASTMSYTLHHADATTESGTLTVPDWFGPGTASEVMAVGARVDALGVNFQFPTPANGFTGSAPYLWSLDIPVTHATSAVTSIDLNYTGGGVISVLGVSSQVTSGGAYAPVAITGFNKDVVVEVGSFVSVDPSIVDVANQSNGTLNLTNGAQLFVGNVGSGVYNMSGGTINASDWFVVGRSGGTGTFNMTGGTINKSGNGQIVVSSRNGASGVGTFNISAGTINSSSEFWIGQGDNNSAGANATNNISGTAVLNLTNWLAVGREGGVGVLNISGGSITKSGNGNVTITHGQGASGTINQTGGSITVIGGQVWVGEDSGPGTWNMSAGTANLEVVHLAQNGSANGTLNLNGGVMTLQELTTGNSGAVSLLNFNGGTLRATTNNGNFVWGLTLASIGAGGATIDSQGFTVTVPQELDDAGGGGLTKLGTGTLILAGANTYTGPTMVNAGTLISSTASGASGNYTVANNAGVGALVLSANAQLNMGNLTVSGPASSLNFVLGNFGNPSSAPINVLGNANLSGTITINVSDDVPQIGQFPLLKYGALVGSPTFVIGSLPNGISASIVNNTANNSIDLNITGVNLPRWDGTINGNWDINQTANWVNLGTGTATFFNNGNAVLFDDNAQGTTNVNITTTVVPSSVTVNDSVLSYAFTGTGKISGSTGLTKRGTGTLTIQNTGGNNYTGPTVVTNGVLNVTSLADGGSPSSIGAASASPTNLVINNATFAYSGTAGVTANRGVLLANTNAVFDAESDFNLSGLVAVGAAANFVKSGPAQFGVKTVGINQFAAGFNPGILVRQGTLLMDGSAGPQTNHTVNEMWVGGTPATGGSLVLSNTVLRVDSWFAVGRGNGTVGNISSASLYNSTLEVGNISFGYDNGIAGNKAFQNISLNGNSVLTNHGDMNLCESAGSTATINLNGNSLLWGQNRFYLPNNGGATGTLAVANSARVVDNAWLSIGNGNNGTGNLIIKDSGNVFVGGDFNVTDTGTSVGNMTLQDSGVASGNAVYFGKSGGSTATITMSGGTLIARSGDLQMGASGSATFNQTSGTVIGTNWISIGRNSGGVGVYNISGGTLMKVNSGNRLNVAESGTGTLNVSGTGSVIVGVGNFADLDICSANGTGTVNLNGGTITAGQVTHLGTGTATFNFNGGTLVAGTNPNATFMSGLTAANVLAGGAKIDSAGSTINIGQALLDGTGGGGLTKLGNGTLRLNGTNTYTGSTVVSAGALGGSGTIAGPVNVAAGAKLAPGGSSIGTLTINNTLTFSNSSSASFRLSNDNSGTNNDQVIVSSVAYAGTLTVSNGGTNSLVTGSTYKLFNAAAHTGNFTSVTVSPSGSATFDPNTGILTITSTGSLSLNHPFVSNGNLVVTGSGTPGASYTLLSSTNLSLPLAQWTTNSSGTFDNNGSISNAIPLSQTNRFFLLRQP